MGKIKYNTEEEHVVANRVRYKKWYKTHKDEKNFKENNKLNAKKYRENHPEKVKETKKKSSKKYRDNPENKEKQKEWHKNWCEANSKKVKEDKRIYYETNKDRITQSRDKNKRNKNNRDKYINNPIFCFKLKITNSLREDFKRNGFSKNKRETEKILGCTIEFFYSYLELQWSLSHNLDDNGQVWMSWGNAGKYKKDCFNYGWDRDHIIPLCTAKTEEDVIRLNHYSNFQPLCSKVNRDIKKDKLNWVR